jgi:hypothetical protein
MYGGEISGEFIISGFDPSLNPYSPAGVIYKTSDYFSHFTLVEDSTYGFYNGEIGKVSGELYQLPLVNGYGYLLHSLDFGANFDTIPVDTTIVNENTGLFFNTLSRGSSPGELFLVTKQSISATEIHYSIYHTTDYGASWQLKSNQVFDNEFQMFTAGRGNCKFYVASTKNYPGELYNTLQIMYSSDCGETFTTYEYLLSPDVAVKQISEGNFSEIEISPNPASDKIKVNSRLTEPSKCSICIYNSSGSIVMQKPEREYTGEIREEIDVQKLTNGIYYLAINSLNQTFKPVKFIVN